MEKDITTEEKVAIILVICVGILLLEVPTRISNWLFPIYFLGGTIWTAKLFAN